MKVVYYILNYTIINKIKFDNYKMKYLLKKQEDPYFCMPACLQAILNNYNVILKQEEIAKKINCNEKGVFDLDPVKNFMNGFGFKFNYFNWNEIANDARDTFLETNDDVLIAIPTSKGEKHVLLLEKFIDPILYAIDPNNIEIYELNLFELTNLMSNRNSGGYGLIEKL